MSPSTLLAHTSLEATLAYRHGQPISVRRFLAEARQLARMLPETAHVINACADRYRFALSLAACLISGRISLLPPTHIARTLEQLRDFAADAIVLADTEHRELRMPVVPFPDPTVLSDPGTDLSEIPSVAPEQLAAWVFTSGSTGEPQPHRKHWGPLRRNVVNEAKALGLAPDNPITLLGTVPSQHMYGLESTVLLAWLSGGAFEATRPFYPADVAARLGACPSRVMLVTTPFHLEKILESDLQLPAIDSLLCATAPLSEKLAARAEAAFRAPLYEIYGSTETGQLATRRTCQSSAWTLFPEIRLQDRSGQTWAEGGHVEQPIPLGDIIEMVDDRRFRLLGRHTDLINLAGKRTSLGWLNQQLLGLPGVTDGSFYCPEGQESEDGSRVVRLAAFVVAPQTSENAILAGLRERMDPVFLPRPLIQLDALPRNPVGKLLRAECDTLLADHLRDRDERHGRLR